jgi:hypothetical protein
MRSEVLRGLYAVEVAFEFQIDGVRCRSLGIYIHRMNFSPSSQSSSLFNLMSYCPKAISCARSPCSDGRTTAGSNSRCGIVVT